MDRDDPKRGPLLKELSALTQLRLWLKSEPNRLLAQPMEELARELAALKVRDPSACTNHRRNYALEPLAARALTAKVYSRRISPASLSSRNRQS